MSKHNTASQRSNQARNSFADLQSLIDRIVHTLGGRGNMAHCPCHDDNSPSLSLSISSDGERLLVHCHAGYDQKVIIGALKNLNLWSSRGYRKTVPRNEYRDPKATDAHTGFVRGRAILGHAQDSPAEYLRSRGITVQTPLMVVDRRTAAKLRRSWEGLPFSERWRFKSFPAMAAAIFRDGRLIGCHTTFLNKDANQRIASKKARFIFGEHKNGYTPLSELREKEDCLVIGEGIETTLSVMQALDLPGIAALTAGNLAQCQVPPADEYIIAADHDDAGSKGARRLSKRLARQGSTVRVAYPPRESDDFNDLLLRDGAHKIKKVVRSAKSEDRGLDLVPVKELLQMHVPALEFLLSPWLRRSHLGMIYAYTGQGKTWLVLAIAHAVVTGRDFLGWECHGKAKTLIVDGEMGVADLKQRLGLICGGKLPNNLFALYPELFDNMDVGLDLATEEGRKLIDEMIDRHGIECVILDNLSTLMTGDENEAESWREVQAWLRTHRSAGRTVIVVHHSNKAGSQSGTSARERILNFSVCLKRRDDLVEGNESVFELSFAKARGMHGGDARTRIIRLSTEDGRAQWTSEILKTPAERIREMKNDGYTQREIAAELGVTEGRVSQLAKKMN